MLLMKVSIAFGIALCALQFVEKRQQLVVGLEHPRLAIDWRRSSQGSLFERDMRMKIGLCGLDRFMPQPQFNDGSVHTRQQQFHGRSVSQDMG